jgi:hypothetical protein
MLSAAEHAGGEGGIRTPDTLAGMPVFKTGAINHSATSPMAPVYPNRPKAEPTTEAVQPARTPQLYRSQRRISGSVGRLPYISTPMR